MKALRARQRSFLAFSRVSGELAQKAGGQKTSGPGLYQLRKPSGLATGFFLCFGLKTGWRGDGEAEGRWEFFKPENSDIEVGLRICFLGHFFG